MCTSSNRLLPLPFGVANRLPFWCFSGVSIKGDRIKSGCFTPTFPGAHIRGNLCTARALRAHCALLLDYAPPEEPPSKPLGNALRIRRPKLPQLKKVANYLPFTEHSSCTTGKTMKSALVATLKNTQLSFSSIVN